jgi:uncharacterized hydrophobic protein (TIGR00271 family)
MPFAILLVMVPRTIVVSLSNQELSVRESQHLLPEPDHGSQLRDDTSFTSASGPPGGDEEEPVPRKPVRRQGSVIATSANEREALENSSVAPHLTVNMEEILKKEMENFDSHGWLLSKPMYTVSQEQNQLQMTVICEQDIAQLMMVKLEYIGVGTEVGYVGLTDVVGRSYLREKKNLQEVRRRLPFWWVGHLYRKARGTADGPSSSPSSAGPTAGLGAYTLPSSDEKFLSIASALRVEALAEEVNAAMEYNFDYILFVLIAAIIAGMGLITNSEVALIASMLVSPIMGPIMGFTFGLTIRDTKMCLHGLMMEMYSLMLCVVSGFILMTLIMCDNPKYVNEWITPEMRARGQKEYLLSGMAIAIPSGMGVALSLLSKNVSSLVGVAISASLLPPAVNAGMLWAYDRLGDQILGLDEATSNTSDGKRLAGISLSLTLVNVMCIFLAGVATFMLKRVAPSRHEDSFWQRDLKKAGGALRRKSLLKEARATRKGSVNLKLFKIPGIQKKVQEAKSDWLTGKEERRQQQQRQENRS